MKNQQYTIKMGNLFLSEDYANDGYISFEETEDFAIKFRTEDAAKKCASRLIGNFKVVPIA